MRAAARVGLTTAVVLGLAVTAGIGGLSLLANTGGAHDPARTAKALVGPAPVTAPALRDHTQLGLAEVLSQLGYLPMSWQPAGSFTWNSGYPASLRAQWRPGQPNVVLRGAVMAFKAQHKLAINGQLTPKFWHELVLAAATAQRNTVGYTYAMVDKGSPETLTIWHDGRQVQRSLANTGIPIRPTVSGTFPVYLRFRYQIMSGTNPDGSHYADPVTFVSYFNGRDAVHYFPRGSYGSPQSLGCVELASNEARRAWLFLTYGSLITVTG